MTTVLNDVILPEVVVAAGLRGKNVRMNQRASNQAGYMQANIVWTQTLRRYEVGYVPMLLAAWAALQGMFEVTEGGAYGFLMLDPADRNASAAEGLLRGYTTADVGAIGTGYGVPVYHLFKRYTSLGSTRTKDRRITRPKSAIAVTRAGAAVTVGASAGNISINYDTGAVTFVADTSESLTSLTAGSSTVLNFASGAGIVAAMSVGQRVYLSGLSGTAAPILNGASHAITAKGASSLTISTSTTGLAATGGTAAKYPQASEAMAWSGSFYVPVQFETDELDWELVRGGDEDDRLVTGPSTSIVEVRE